MNTHVTILYGCEMQFQYGSMILKGAIKFCIVHQLQLRIRLAKIFIRLIRLLIPPCSTLTLYIRRIEQNNSSSQNYSPRSAADRRRVHRSIPQDYELLMKLKTSIDQWPPLQARDFLLFSLNHPALLFGSRGTDVDLLSSGFELTPRDLVANDSVETVLSTFCLSFDFNVLRLIVPGKEFFIFSPNPD